MTLLDDTEASGSRHLTVFTSSAKPSAAPEVEEFEPPVPTPADPYPGYYQLPSGRWALYDPVYYRSCWQDWGVAIRLDENSGTDVDGLLNVSAQDEIRKGKQVIATQKNLTRNIKSGREAPNMNIEVC